MHLPRRMFLPLVLILSAIAVYAYFAGGRFSTPRDLREAVPVVQFTLHNGLQVAVIPNDGVPAVTHLLLVKAGSGDDPYGKSGLAHYLEHLMFTGTPEVPENVYDQSIARVGGDHNAYTTADYTVYHATVAREHLATVMAMEADRLQHLSFDAPRAARELKVITEERQQRVENSPFAQFHEQLAAMSFLNHPYQHPVIGWAEDMAGLTAADAQDFFHRYYRASNMMLVIAGDVSVSDVRRLAQKYYGALPMGEAPPRVWPKEPPLRMERHATMRDARVQEARLVRQYVAPSLMDGDTAKALPLALFAQHLGGGSASLLYHQLVRVEKLASNVEVNYDPFTRGPELFQILVTPVSGVSLETLEVALDRAMASAIATLPEADSVSRAKTLMTAEAVYAQDGMTGLGHLMARLYAVGLDEQTFYEWSARIARITAAQMQESAAAVLAPSRRITGYLLPDQVKGGARE